MLEFLYCRWVQSLKLEICAEGANQGGARKGNIYQLQSRNWGKGTIQVVSLKSFDKWITVPSEEVSVTDLFHNCPLVGSLKCSQRLNRLWRMGCLHGEIACPSWQEGPGAGVRRNLVSCYSCCSRSVVLKEGGKKKFISQSFHLATLILVLMLQKFLPALPRPLLKLNKLI